MFRVGANLVLNEHREHVTTLGVDSGARSMTAPPFLRSISGAVRREAHPVLFDPSPGVGHVGVGVTEGVFCSAEHVADGWMVSPTFQSASPRPRVASRAVAPVEGLSRLT